jgi:hypothetical protein
VSDHSKILKISKQIEIRRVTGPGDPSVVQKEQSVIRTVGCDKFVLKTSYRGPQGPRGDTSSFNDLEIPSLRQRFLNKLV